MPEFVGKDFKNEWRDLADEDYHKDLTAVARGDLLAFRKSGRAFLARRTKEETGGVSDAMRFGRAAHMLALEPEKFKKTFVIMPEFTGMTKDGTMSTRSKDAIQKRDAWLNELPPGTEILKTEQELKDLVGIYDALLLHPDSRDLFTGGIVERCGYYRDPITGLKCRIKPDCINTKINGLFDFKTTTDCSYKRFSASIWEHRYDFQLEMYSQGAAQILGVKPDILGWGAVEKTAPYEVAVWIADSAMLEIAERHYRQALDGLASTIRNGGFGFQQERAQNIGLPMWAMSEA